MRGIECVTSDIYTSKLTVIGIEIIICGVVSKFRIAINSDREMSKRSATTTATVPTKTKSAGSAVKKDDPSKPCKLCAQDTILAAPTVKRKGDPLPSSAPLADGRKIGENKLLSKTSKTTRYTCSEQD
jgi:hypothetical protein